MKPVIVKLIKKNKQLKSEIKKLKQERNFYKKELDSITANQKREHIEESEDKKILKNVDGWTVCRHKSYFRISKKIKGKQYWIHVGKDWSISKAQSKIKNFYKKTHNFNNQLELF